MGYIWCFHSLAFFLFIVVNFLVKFIDFCLSILRKIVVYLKKGGVLMLRLIVKRGFPIFLRQHSILPRKNFFYPIEEKEQLSDSMFNKWQNNNINIINNNNN